MQGCVYVAAINDKSGDAAVKPDTRTDILTLNPKMVVTFKVMIVIYKVMI